LECVLRAMSDPYEERKRRIREGYRRGGVAGGRAAEKAWNEERQPRKREACDHLCVRYLEKQCVTDREDELCDQPEMYRETGDVVDRMRDEKHEL